jgi:hypothetical protein
VNFLVAAYLRRKRWEFRGQAAAVINALGESMGGKPAASRNGTYVAGHREISPEEMIQRLNI